MVNNDNRLRIWTEQGNVTIPQLFFQFYKELNIADDEALIILHLLAFHAQGNDFPTPNDLKTRMDMQGNAISNQLQKLMQKGFMEITQGVDASGKLSEKYSLYPLWERILHLLETKSHKQEVKSQKQEEGEIFNLFEAELGRLLSPMELETINMWIDVDKHSPTIIKMALKEAVLASKVNLRYIDRILFEWKKKNIQTPQQVEKQAEQFRQHSSSTNVKPETQATPPTNKVQFYNWLEERE